MTVFELCLSYRKRQLVAVKNHQGVVKTVKGIAAVVKERVV